jgi:DNA-binding transcriptional ArsR family regulator
VDDAWSDDALPEVLETLGNPGRLGLMRQMRRPRRVADLDLRAAGAERVGRASRQAVQHHLRKLLAAGLVEMHSRGAAFVGNEYLVSQRQLFAVTEQLRDLVRPEPDDALDQGETRAGIPLQRPPAPGARSLVLVHGVEEGRSWPLPSSRPLRIGRARACDVRIDYDPFASATHAQVEDGPQGAWLTDAGSRNGTYLNWQRLGRGEKRPLVAGDAIGVGRSILVLRG